MEGLVKALYSCAFTVWNSLIDIAMTLFTTSPRDAAGGSPYAVVHSLYDVISGATVPLATVFFLIAIFKTVVTTPSGQQAQRFLQDSLKYCVVLCIASNMWAIMGYVMEFADGITSQIVATESYTLAVSGDMEAIIDSCLEMPGFELTGEWIAEFWITVGCTLLFMLGGVVLVFIMAASSISIISSAFQRILKPLMILPFAWIAISLGSGGHYILRSLVSYVKTFFGFCISGALMVVAVKCGTCLCTNLVNLDLATGNDVSRCILLTVHMSVTPIVVSGLVRGCDSVVARMF